MEGLLKLIKSFGNTKTFTEQTSDDWNDKSDDFIDHITEKHPSKQDVAKFFSYIDSQIAKKYFPAKESPGQELITNIIDAVMRALRYDEKHEHDYNAELFDLLITCLKAGTDSGHMEVLNELPIQGEFYEVISKADVSRLLDLYQSPLLEGLSATEEDKDDISDNLTKPLNEIEGKQFKPCEEQVRNMWLSLSFRLMDASEPIAYILNSLTYKLSDILDSDLEVLVYKYSDQKVIQEHIAKTKTSMIKQDYPKTEFAQECAKHILEYMVKYLEKNGDVRKKVINDLNDMTIDIMGAGNKQAMEDVSDETRSFLEEYKKEIKSSPEQGLKIMSNMIQKIKEIQTDDEDSSFDSSFGAAVRETFIKTVKPENWKMSQEFVLACVGCGQDKVMELASNLMEKRKALDWKTNPDVAKAIFEKLLSLGEDPDRLMNNYGTFTDNFLSNLKGQKVIGDYQHYLMAINEKSLSGNNLLIQGVARETFEETQWVKNKDHIHRILALDLKALEDNPEMQEYTGGLAYCVYFSLQHILSALLVGQDGTFIANDLAKLFHLCKEREWKTPDNETTVEYTVLSTIMSMYLERHGDKPECLAPVLDDVKDLRDCGDETLEREADSVLKGASNSAALLGEDTVAEIIQSYLDGSKPDAYTEFEKYYQQMPHLILTRLQEIAQTMESSEEYVALSIMSLLYNISKDNQQAIDKSVIELTVKHMKGHSVFIGLQILLLLAGDRPEDIMPYENQIIDIFQTNKQAAPMIPNILVALTNTEGLAIKYLALLNQVAKDKDSMQKIGFYYAMRTIGLSYREPLAKYKDMFEKIKKEDKALTDTAQAALDVIEGRSLKGLSEDVSEHGKQIDQLEDRVDITEEDIENLSKEVENTQADVLHLKEDTAQAEERLNTLEDVVEETVDRVDDLDLKTLSHAPSWSPEVSKLMNPEAEHDWRLLASRLGYTIDDIKNWATQPDPCLSLLDEWFATHKTREATYAVLKCLEDMGREDAAVIVHDALAAVEDIVDEAPPDLAEPPPIFISYQWGIQPECKLLKKHLEMAGFKAWMDIGQMGGGDKLYAKIDEGIRAAKVIICCVSEKYAQSPNCNREVNLSVTLGKPIIPLLMEKMSWPPPGSMGPIFGEYLFIRFFQRSAETTDDEGIYWPPPKFQELLMQLRYSIVPDESIVTGEYKEWWAPPEETIVIKSNKEKSSTTNTESNKGTGEQNAKPSSPEVFISYQWGKQPQIKALYNRLSQLGFACWLDILQMGGGDSLYDKIDRGVRGCKVIISCVTTKYSLSANCRREVSLADAIKKPIIPLMLESITWPPEGPMSMPFTQLVYINFSKPDDSIQNHWECPQFEELLQKIIAYVGPQNGISPEDKKPIPSSQPNPVKPPTPAPRKNPPSRPASAKSKVPSRPPSAQSKRETSPKVTSPRPSSARAKSPTPSQTKVPSRPPSAQSKREISPKATSPRPSSARAKSPTPSQTKVPSRPPSAQSKRDTAPKATSPRPSSARTKSPTPSQSSTSSRACILL